MFDELLVRIVRCVFIAKRLMSKFILIKFILLLLASSLKFIDIWMQIFVMKIWEFSTKCLMSKLYANRVVYVNQKWGYSFLNILFDAPKCSLCKSNCRLVVCGYYSVWVACRHSFIQCQNPWGRQSKYDCPYVPKLNDFRC